MKPHQNEIIAISQALTNEELRALLHEVIDILAVSLPHVKALPALNQFKFWLTPSSSISDCLIYLELTQSNFHAHVALMSPNIIQWAVPEWLKPAIKKSKPGHHLLSKIMIDATHLENKEAILELFSKIALQLSKKCGILPRLNNS